MVVVDVHVLHGIKDSDAPGFPQNFYTLQSFVGPICKADGGAAQDRSRFRLAVLQRALAAVQLSLALSEESSGISERGLPLQLRRPFKIL